MTLAKVPIPWVDLAFYAHAAGFRGEDAAIAIALTQPESERKWWVSNLSDPNGGSHGLLQNNGIHDPNFNRETGLPTDAWVQSQFDPQTNFKTARKTWENVGGSWEPWGAYTSGLHERWLPVAKCAMDARQRIAARDRKVDNLENQLQAEQDRADALLALYDNERFRVARALERVNDLTVILKGT